MRAIVLAAGEGARMRPLTAKRPKALLPVGGRPLIERTLLALAENGVRDATLVVGYCGDAVRARIGDGERLGIRVSYAEQPSPRGTADAVASAPEPREPFLIANADVLLTPAAVAEVLRHADAAVAVAGVPDAGDLGVVEERNGRLAGVREKPGPSHGPGLVNAGLYLVPPEFHMLCRKVAPSPRGEHELVDALVELARSTDVHVVEVLDWMDLAHPHDLLAANERVLSGIAGDVRGRVEAGATLAGPVVVEEGARVRSGAYIEGPVFVGAGSDVGPNSFVRGSTSIGRGCRVGNAVEVKNSVLMDGVHVGHLSYVGDSILGEHVNLGAGTIVANLRHDGRSIAFDGPGGRIDTGRRKFGVVVGDGVHTGIGTRLNVGVALPAGHATLPGEVVMRSPRP